MTPIAAELAQFEVYFEQTMKAETEPMDDIMRYVQESRGKRLRPILVLLSAKLFGEVNERTQRAATFVEMVHSATLIHDDVVDDADQRRSKASVKAKFGNHSAVLAGDYLCHAAAQRTRRPCHPTGDATHRRRHERRGIDAGDCRAVVPRQPQWQPH